MSNPRTSPRSSYWALLLTYGTVGLVGFVIYVFSFRLPIELSVIFYRGVALACLVALLLFIALRILSGRLAIDRATILGAVLVSLSFNLCFLVLLPVTVDRSITVFLLSRLEMQPGQTSADLEARFRRDYLQEMGQIPRRVAEQVISGNVEVSPTGAIKLTERGLRFNAFARAVAAWFGTDPRFVASSPNEQTNESPTRDEGAR